MYLVKVQLKNLYVLGCQILDGSQIMPVYWAAVLVYNIR